MRITRVYGQFDDSSVTSVCCWNAVQLIKIHFPSAQQTSSKPPNMTTEWARKCLSDPSSTPASNQQVTIIDELLSSKTSPKSSASATASLVEAQDDISFALADLVGLYYSAAESCTSLKELELLVAYLVALARLPDAVNRGPEARSWDVPGLEPPRKIEVGEVIVIEGKRLWSQLPGFSMHLTEMFQGKFVESL